MADVAIAIRTYLLTKTAITDVVGQRIYADKLPQTATLPAMEMEVVSDVPDMQLSDITGLTKARIDFRCISGRRVTSRALSQAIRNCGIVAIKGLFTSVWIRGVALLASYDTDDIPTDGSDESRYSTSVQFEVCYMEA